MNPLNLNVNPLSTHHKTESSPKGKSRVGKSKEAPEREKKVSKQSAKLSEVHEAPEIRPHTPKGEKKVSLYDQVPEFQKKVDAFIHGIKTDKLDKKEIAAFHKYLKNQRLPMTEQQLNEIKAVVAPKENHYHNESKITKIIELSAKLRTVLGKTVDIQDIEKNEALKARSSPLWDCIDRVPNETGGYSYIFRARDEYDDVTDHPDLEKRKVNTDAKVAELYPAIDPKPRELLLFDPNIGHEKRLEMIYELSMASMEALMAPFPNLPGLKESFKEHIFKPNAESALKKYNQIIDLGLFCTHSKEGVFLTIPDTDTLMVRWAKLRETDPSIPPLTLAPSEGIADDVSFVESFFKDDVLISDEKEFVHDMGVHALKTMVLMLTKETPAQIFDAVIDNSTGLAKLQEVGSNETDLNTDHEFIGGVKIPGVASYSTSRIQMIKLVAGELSRIQTFKTKLKDNPQLVTSNESIMAELEMLSKNYGLKNNLVELFKNPQRTSELLEQLEKILGAFVDTISTQENDTIISYMITNPEQFRILILGNPQWSNFMNKTFGEKLLSPLEIAFSMEVMKHVIKVVPSE